MSRGVCEERGEGGWKWEMKANAVGNIQKNGEEDKEIEDTAW